MSAERLEELEGELDAATEIVLALSALMGEMMQAALAPDGFKRYLKSARRAVQGVMEVQNCGAMSAAMAICQAKETMENGARCMLFVAVRDILLERASASEN